MVPPKKVGTANIGLVRNAIADGKLIPLKTLCGQFHIDPRLARRKLRSAGIAGHSPSERWVFKAGSAALTKAREALRAGV